MQHGKGNPNKVISPSTSSVSLSSQSSKASSLRYSLLINSLPFTVFSCHLCLIIIWVFLLKLQNNYDIEKYDSKGFLQNISDIT